MRCKSLPQQRGIATQFLSEHDYYLYSKTLQVKLYCFNDYF